jgi:hypothetical protein
MLPLSPLAGQPESLCSNDKHRVFHDAALGRRSLSDRYIAVLAMQRRVAADIYMLAVLDREIASYLTLFVAHLDFAITSGHDNLR